MKNTKYKENIKYDIIYVQFVNCKIFVYIVYENIYTKNNSM